MSARLKVFGLLVLAFLFESLSVNAATLDSLQGNVFVNRGDGFKPVQAVTSLEPGASIMVSEQGKARLFYFDGCAQDIAPGQVVVVAANPPCNPIETGATPKPAGSQPSNWSWQNMKPFDGAEYVLGAAAVGGIVAIAVVGLSDDDGASAD